MSKLRSSKCNIRTNRRKVKQFFVAKFLIFESKESFSKETASNNNPSQSQLQSDFVQTIHIHINNRRNIDLPSWRGCLSNLRSRAYSRNFSFFSVPTLPLDWKTTVPKLVFVPLHSSCRALRTHFIPLLLYLLSNKIQFYLKREMH